MVAEVSNVGTLATVTGSLGPWPLVFAPYEDRQVALVGLDLDMPSGVQDWRVEIREPGRPPRTLAGRLGVGPRTFSVQRLTLPRGMVDLDPETEHRANAESARLRSLYRTITTERLWRGPFVKPVAGDEPGTGFGARRVINGQLRAPHTGVDYRAPTGASVRAANAGRVALVDEFFFPGRLVVIDHGLGLHTLYFHLDTVSVSEGQVVERGQGIGTVGATGRATGPHLHFGAHIGEARVDPTALLEVEIRGSEMGGLDWEMGGLERAPQAPPSLGAPRGTRDAPR
jgi:hypothetical protein